VKARRGNEGDEPGEEALSAHRRGGGAGTGGAFEVHAAVTVGQRDHGILCERGPASNTRSVDPQRGQNWNGATPPLSPVRTNCGVSITAGWPGLVRVTQ
jgi:hypothetical protein